MITGWFRASAAIIFGLPQIRPFNPHLTKTRLNDAQRLCEMLHGTFGRGIKRDQVELFWTQGE
jgi:hypothetical protein